VVLAVQHKVAEKLQNLVCLTSSVFWVVMQRELV
jgi:hypothetical protein